MPKLLLSYIVCAAGIMLEDESASALSLLQLQVMPVIGRYEAGERLPAVEEETLPQQVMQRLSGQVVLQMLLDPVRRSKPEPNEQVEFASSSSARSGSAVQQVLQTFHQQLQIVASHVLGPGVNASEVVDAIGQIVLDQSAHLVRRSVSVFIESGLALAGEKAAAAAKENLLSFRAASASAAVSTPVTEYDQGRRPTKNSLALVGGVTRGSVVAREASSELRDVAPKPQQALKPFLDAIAATTAAALGSALNETSEMIKGLFADSSRLVSEQFVQFSGQQLGNALGAAVGKAVGTTMNDTRAGIELGQLVVVVLGGQVNAATQQAVGSELSSCFNTTMDKLQGKIQGAMGHSFMSGQETIAPRMLSNMYVENRSDEPPRPWSAGQLLEAAEGILQQLVGGLVVDLLSQATGIIKQTTETAASLLALRMGEAMQAPLAEALTPAFTQILSENANDTETGATVGTVLAETLASRVDDLSAEALTKMVVNEIDQSLDRLVGQVRRAVGGEPIDHLLATIHPRNAQHEHLLQSLRLVTSEVQAQSHVK